MYALPPDPSLYGNVSSSSAAAENVTIPAQSLPTYDLPVDSANSNGTPMLEGDRPYCRTLFDFRGECPGELNFSAGDLLYLHQHVNDEWLRGESQSTGLRGIFPRSFVDIVVPLSNQDETVTKGSHPASTASDQQFVGADESGPNGQIGVASVLYDFEPRFADELAVRAGDSVQVLALVDTEWARCRDPANGQSGIVPQGFLHIFLDSTAQVLDSTAPSDKVGMPEIARPNLPTWDDFPTFQSISNLAHHPQQQSHHPSPSLYPTLGPSTDSSWTPLDTAKGIPMMAPPPPRPPPPKMIPEAAIAMVEEPLAKSKSAPKLLAMAGKTAKNPKKSKKSTSSTHQKKSKSSSSTSAIAYHQQSVESEAEEADESLIVGVPNSSVNPHLEMFPKLETSAATQSDAKQKVVLDLLNTERTYLNDLDAWETCLQESAELSPQDKKAMTNGYAPLKQLSQALIDAIEAQKDLPAGDQYFGQTFMELKDRFYSAYAFHFRCVEQISAIVENDDDQSLQKALQNCLLAMRQRGSNVFDVPTAVSRPIQRCLKYPLYVGEILKNTPIHHPDHPKLMEALRQLGNLASRMNECKRRKELIRKYRAQEQLSLADRLSRINMHSLVKKSNRLKYRINRTIGLGTVKDTEFDYLVQLLEEAERRLCKFLYCAQLYKKHMELSAKRHEESYKGACQAQDERIVKAFAVMFRRVDELCRRHLQTFDQEIVNEGKKLVRSELTKLVHKRFDKLADYETAKATNKNPDEVEMRRAEFEALNNQIKAQLPRVIGTINKRVLQLIQLVNELDVNFMRRMDEWFASERPDKVRECAPAALPFRAHLTASLRATIVELDKIAAHLFQRAMPEGNEEGTGVVVARRKSLRLSLRAPKGQSRVDQRRASQRHKPSSVSISTQRRTQSVKERDALVKICQAQHQSHQLRRIQRDWDGASIVLRQGDVVMVKAHRQDGFSLCDNAVVTEWVPIAVLGTFDDSNYFVPPGNNTTDPNNVPIPQPKPSSSPTKSKPANTPQQQQLAPDSFDASLLLCDFSSSSATTPPNSLVATATNPAPLSKIASSKKGTGDLIDLEENLIDLDSPPKIGAVQRRDLAPIQVQQSEFPLVDYEREPGSKRFSEPGFLASLGISAKKTTTTISNDDPFDELFQAAMQLSKTPNDSLPRKESPPVPAIPDRPMSSSSASTASWSLPAPSVTDALPSKSSTSMTTGAGGGNQPIRIAPPPPNHRKRATTPQQQLKQQVQAVQPQLAAQQQPHVQAVQQPPKTNPSSTMAVCAFDFLPSGDNGQSGSGNQLQIREGDMVEVLRRHDDAGNAEWWLVRRMDQQQQKGYVPANYLTIPPNNTQV